MYAIETNQLTKFYGKSRGIENVDLTINEGEVFGFIGPNGAGKSTTIRTLLNLIYPTSGKAKIFGLDSVKDTKKIKYSVGYIPSEVNYYDDMTVEELLLYSASFYKNVNLERIQELIELFEVDKRKEVPDLSFGNKKKVAIIQALLHEPKLLILDEPTSGLDPLMQNKFFDLLKEEKKKGTTIFFSSHVLDEVQKICDRVAIIKEGKIIKIEEVGKLRQGSYKKISIELNREITEPLFLIDGMHNISINGKLIKFLYYGDLNILTNQLATIELKNLWLEEPSLEEIFMHFYE